MLPLLAALAACGTTATRPPDPGERAAIVRESGSAPASAPAATVPGEEALVPRPEVPADAAASFRLALDSMASGDWFAAELELEQLVLLYPSFAGPHVNLAIVYRQDGRDAEARAALERALAIAPEHPAANNALGMLHREDGEFDAAEAAYRRAIAGDPAYGLAHYNLGVLLDLYLRREDEALEQYEIYQDLQDQPDQEVGFWIVDIRRRLGLPPEPEQLAQEDGR
jgi:tetratricopeptide (TPR) repeat protein